MAMVEIWRDDTGTWLDLNGDNMSHTLDEHRYHEMLVHPALFAAKRHEDILIIGGSEGATLREVLRHSSVQNVTMVDIDEDLVNMCRTHLPMMHKGSFSSPKAHVLFEDGAHYIRRQAPQVLDVVIVDGIDFDAAQPYGNNLFSSEFYAEALRVLRPGGVLVQYMSDIDRRSEMHRAGFNQTLSFAVDVPSYHGEGARFIMATKHVAERFVESLPRLVAEAKLDGDLLFVEPETMRLALLHTGRRLKGGGGYGGGSGGTMGTWQWLLLILLGCCGCAYCYYKCFHKKSDDGQSDSLMGSQSESE